MKLSKGQQHVVDRMKEGWSLTLSAGPDSFAWLTHNDDGTRFERVNLNTFSGLEHRRIIFGVNRTTWQRATKYVLAKEE